MTDEPRGPFLFSNVGHGSGGTTAMLRRSRTANRISAGAQPPRASTRAIPHTTTVKPINYIRLLAVFLILSTAAVWHSSGAEAGIAVAFMQASALAWAANRRRHALGVYTQISDVIQPDTWLPYSVQRSVELSALVQAGVIDPDPLFDALADAGGSTVNMPFWNDLTGEDEVLSDQNPLTTGKIDSAQDVAAMINRGRAWKHNDLAKIFSGDDPAQVAADLVGGYWSRRMQQLALSELKGIFGTAGMAGHVLNISIAAPGATAEVNYLTGESWIAGGQLLGDHKDSLTAAIMHSAVEASLAARGLIEYVQEAGQSERIRTFMGKRIVIDDGMPVDVVNAANRYTTYIFGRGALALGNSNKTAQEKPEGALGTWGAEFFRESLASNSGLITRRRMILHPRGIKWLGAAQAGSSPTNLEIANPANWLRVWDAKKIPVVAIQHNIPNG